MRQSGGRGSHLPIFGKCNQLPHNPDSGRDQEAVPLMIGAGCLGPLALDASIDVTPFVLVAQASRRRRYRATLRSAAHYRVARYA